MPEDLDRDMRCHILPVRVVLGDQGVFPGAGPALDGALALQAGGKVLVHLEPDQRLDLVLRSMDRCTGAVRLDPRREVGSPANVDRATRA